MESLRSEEPEPDSSQEQRWGRHEDERGAGEGAYKDKGEDEEDEEQFVIDSRQGEDDESQDDISWEGDSQR
jgi:hypothetical protein